MSWELRYSDKALKQLRKLDPGVRGIILSWMAKNVQGCANPRSHGKQLVGNLASSWQYRIGDYRVICDIQDGELIVLALTVAHRKDAYRKP